MGRMKLPNSSNCDKIQAVFVQQVRQSTLYVATTDGQLYFCNGPFVGPNITWKGPHAFPQKLLQAGLINYALAVYDSNLAIVGGWNQKIRSPTDQVWILQKASSQATQFPSKMLTKRFSAVAVGSEKYLAVAGGINEVDLSDVEIYNGAQWLEVKPGLPKKLRNLASVLHNGVWYLIEEVYQNEAGATYSAKLEELISQKAQWQKIDQCSSGEMLAGPVSFDGQLLVIKEKLYSGYGVHIMLPQSPEKKFWVHIAPLESTNEFQHCKFRHASMVGLPEGQLMVITTDSALLIGTIKGKDFVKDENFSLTSLMKLEHGHNVPVLSSLKGHKLWQLKDKVVFDLKFDRGSDDEPAVYLYINSWLKDANAGCSPTWNNLLVLLQEVGLQDVAQQILTMLSPDNQALSDISIATETGVEALLNLQSQLGSLSIPVTVESAQDLREQIQQHCHVVMWEQKKMKRKQEKVKEERSLYLPKRLEDEKRTKVLKQAQQMQQNVVRPGLPSTHKRPNPQAQMLAPTSKLPRTIAQVASSAQLRDHQESNIERSEAIQARKLSMSDRPKLHELDLIEANGRKVKLIEKVSGKWETMATRLYFEGSDITRIKRDNLRQSVDCCRDVFIEWLDGRGRKPITWKELIKAVSEAEFSEVANDLTVICS